jgi:ABC-type nickel/cobalt efflux system permease component RcnA
VRIVPILALALATLGALSTPASAHPLGNFTVNRYSRIEVSRAQVALRYVLDLAEIPTLQELGSAASSGTLDAAQRATVIARLAPRVREGAHLWVGGARARWRERDASIELVPGQAGLSTLRLALTLVAPMRIDDGADFEYRDTSFADRIGWREVVLRPGAGVRIDGATVPEDDETDELRRYPSDPLRPPLAVSSATARIRLVAEGAPGPDAAGAAGVARLGMDAMSDQIGGLVRAGAAGDGLASLLAVIAAAGLGVAHALTPGHGKTLMAAYLVGTRGSVRQAVALGAIVAVTHTAGVLGLGLVVLGASAVMTPERLYPYLSALSALVLLGIGGWMAVGVARRYAHERAHRHGQDHDHEHAHVADGAVGWRALAALGVSGGAVPSASALLLLLASVALGRPDLGVLLIAAFGVGMATVLVGLGLSVVGVGRLAARRLAHVSPLHRLGSVVPVASTAVVLIVGVALTVQAGQGMLATFALRP